MKTVFKNALLGGELTDITVEDGRFSCIGKTNEDGIDIGGMRIMPGLIDIHTHGCAGCDTMDGEYAGLEKMSREHARCGVTAWLPTTMTADINRLKEITAIDTKDIYGAKIEGFHLEGPYIAEKYKGAQNPKYIKTPDYAEFSEIENVRMITVAPELEGSMEFIERVSHETRRKDKSCVVSLGHTDADYDTAVTAIESGALCLTHVFNAMPPLHHRKPGVIGAAVQKNIYVQVICDGLHIHPSVILALYKMFGTERMILISDSMRATGLEDGKYDLGGLDVYVKNNSARLADGTLAGSISTLLGCVRCAIRFGIPESDAFEMASGTPARILGLNKGRIEPGYDADFIVLDSEYNVCKTVIGGEVFNPEKK